MRYPKGVIKGNEIVYQDENIVKMKCSNCDETFTISKESLDHVKNFTWHKGTTGYIMSSSRTDNEKIKIHKLHRELLKDELSKPENKDMVVDHIDRDKTNNTLENLRVVPVRINGHNSQQAIDARVQVFGVKESYGGRYVVSISTEGKRYNLGTYEDKYEAGLVYDSYIYNHLPESEYGAMNIRNGNIPQETLDRLKVDIDDPSTIPFIPSSKQGNNNFNGVSKDKNYDKWVSYVSNGKGGNLFISRCDSELEAAAAREQYILDHPELDKNNLMNRSNIVWHEETDNLKNVAGIILTRDEYEEKTRGY